MSRAAVYYRVSTDKQDLAMQRHVVEKWLAGRKTPFESVSVFADEGISGKTTRRPEFQRMLAAIAAGEIDAVVVYRLDRVSRHAITALSLILDWVKAGVEFFAVDQPILQLGSDNPIRLTVIALFSELAQIERETTVARVKAGLAAAKARGKKLGAERKFTDEQCEQARAMLAEGHTMRTVARRLGVSHSTIHRNLRG